MILDSGDTGVSSRLKRGLCEDDGRYGAWVISTFGEPVESLYILLWYIGKKN